MITFAQWSKFANIILDIKHTCWFNLFIKTIKCYWVKNALILNSCSFIFLFYYIYKDLKKNNYNIFKRKNIKNKGCAVVIEHWNGIRKKSQDARESPFTKHVGRRFLIYLLGVVIFASCTKTTIYYSSNVHNLVGQAFKERPLSL